MIGKLLQWIRPLYRRTESPETLRLKHYAQRHMPTRRKTYSPTSQMRRLMSVIAYSALCQSANAKANRQLTTQLDSDSYPIGIDNRCSACISCEIQDFVGEVYETKVTIKGFGGTRTKSVKKGTIKWSWEDDKGRIHAFHIPNSYYVPQGNVRLLSPQHWAQQQRDSTRRGTGEETTARHVTLFWEGRRSQRTVNIDPDSNVATIYSAPGISNYLAFKAEAGLEREDYCNPICFDSNIISDDEEEGTDEGSTDSDPMGSDPEGATSEGAIPRILTDSDPMGSDPEGAIPQTPQQVEFDLNGIPNKNSTPVVIEIDEETKQPTVPSAELLMMHQKYNHAPMRKLQELARQGILPMRLSKCPTPVCTACLYGKATKRPWRTKLSNNKSDSLPAEESGDVVSVDQLDSPTPGLVAQITGILTTKRYTCATVFVDHHSGLSYVHIQQSTAAKETLQAKEAFENFARSCGINRIKHYHCDNGVFAGNKWRDQCMSQGQGLTFAAVGAHHQNGRAERRIRQLQDLTRTTLIHAQSRWPGAITPNLWPYAMRMANASINNTPNMQHKTKLTPLQIFASTNAYPSKTEFRPFGCPVYVLEQQLQGGKSRIFHKWKNRARRGIYLGRSPSHSRSVALVMNPKTGLVSPQFHVRFDEQFTTAQDGSTEDNWKVKAGFVKATENNTDGKKNVKKVASPQPQMDQQIEGTDDADGSDNEANENEDLADGEVATHPEEDAAQEHQTPSEEEEIHESQDNLPVPPNETRRSSRHRRPIRRLIETMLTLLTYEAVNYQVHTPHTIPGEILRMPIDMGSDTQAQYQPLTVMKATADPDTLYLHEAMREPDKEQFKLAMEKEISDQLNNGNFTVIPRTEVPKGARIIPTVWQLRRKRDIMTGQIKKWKARLNIDGSKMIKHQDYELTYAPVASWTSIRLLLTMTALHDWHTQQLDFVQAFPQAMRTKPCYVTIPKGYDIEGKDRNDYVLKIDKNVYGAKDAGRTWNQHLVKRLKRIGFKQSQWDECVFYYKTTMYVLYTDDSILAGPNRKEIDEIMTKMKEIDLEITDEGTLSDFLGVNIDRRDDGSIEFRQPHLINQILEDLRMTNNDIKTKDTPMASSKLLSRHPNSEDFDNSFHYRSVIGKLNYLEKGSRMDIAYAVHQCARFSHCPKKEHGDAVRWIARYLKGTRSKGYIMTPDKSKGLEVHVDADFAGNWDAEIAFEDRDTARSRHGYIISYGGCPLTYKSQLQTECALSSTESEYTGLSYALREAIPVIEILKEMNKQGFETKSEKPKVMCKVFEDNSGALEMAKVPKARPRTKHINVKLHHFRDYVERGEITIHKISTDDQTSDILTKPLNYKPFAKHRYSAMGW